MKNIILNWDKIKKRLNNKIIALFLDFDGTLSPIVKNPNKAFITKETKQLLSNLSKNPRCRLAIISGRQLKDIKNRVGINKLVYAGNHGLEVSGPSIRFKSPVSSEYKKNLQNIRNKLINNLSVIKGVIVEDKGLSLSVHYRMVDIRKTRKVASILHKTINDYVLHKEVRINWEKSIRNSFSC